MAGSEFCCEHTVVHEEAVRDAKRQMQTDETYSRAADFFKLLGDLTRVKIIGALDCRELCVCDISNILGMTKSAVSHQLALLRKAGFVTFRRDGKTVYYSLADEHIREILEAGIVHIQE
jgi:DNA-binding transcriptional ArsR family regulator